MPDRVETTRQTGLKQARRAVFLGGALSLVLAACAAPPPPIPPTVAKLTIDVAKDANATEGGQGAPTIVRVYQLASTAGFEKAEFFRLLNGDTALLGQDMVKKDEYLLAPGAHKDEMMTVPDRVTALGVLAAYREFSTRTWRVVVPLPPHATTPVAITVGATGLVAK